MMLTNVPETNGVGPHFPSRRDNPFATCWTRPGALPFRFADGQDAQSLVAQLAAKNWWGAIVGPHGSGKSTLLEALKPALSRVGRRVLAIALRDGQRRLPREFFDAFVVRRVERNSLVLIDGYEQLGWLERLRLARCCRRAGAGLLVTAHAPTRLPTLIQLAPNQRLIEQLVADLCVEVSTPIAAEDVAASHACHDSNVREIFFDLYDHYERKRRSERTRNAAATY
jgi:energy-coupling factor transporter ATP-binding protein EcfA2